MAVREVTRELMAGQSIVDLAPNHAPSPLVSLLANNRNVVRYFAEPTYENATECYEFARAGYNAAEVYPAIDHAVFAECGFWLLVCMGAKPETICKMPRTAPHMAAFARR